MADADAEELTRQENLAYFQRVEQMLNEPDLAEDEVSLSPPTSPRLLLPICARGCPRRCKVCHGGGGGGSSPS